MPNHEEKPKSAKSKRRNGRTDEIVYDKVFAAIIDNQLKPATRLHEDGLATAFGVSRTVIRAALQRLAHERLVELIPNKGAIVARPSAEEARQVFEARRTLECAILAQISLPISDAQIAHLRELVQTEELAEGDKRRRVQLSGEFHHSLAAILGNDVLKTILRELISRSSLVISLYETAGAVPCSCTDHSGIVEALAGQDIELAVQRMRKHMSHIETQLDLSGAPAGVDFSDIFSAIE